MSNRNIPNVLNANQGDLNTALVEAVNELFKRVYTLTNPAYLVQTSELLFDMNYSMQGVIADSSGGDVDVYLPPLSDAEHRVYVVHKPVAANNIVVRAASINGGTTDTLSTQYTTRLYFPLPDYWTLIS